MEALGSGLSGLLVWALTNGTGALLKGSLSVLYIYGGLQSRIGFWRTLKSNYRSGIMTGHSFLRVFVPLIALMDTLMTTIDQNYHRCMGILTVVGSDAMRRVRTTLCLCCRAALAPGAWALASRMSWLRTSDRRVS